MTPAALSFGPWTRESGALEARIPYYKCEVTAVQEDGNVYHDTITIEDRELELNPEPEARMNLVSVRIEMAFLTYAQLFKEKYATHN